VSESQSVVITGRGVVSPLGSDWPSFAAAVRERTPAPLAPFPGCAAPDPPLCRPLSGAVPGGESRRDGEPLTALATAAATAALREAGIPFGERSLDDIGLVMSTVLGPSTAVEQYLETLQAKGPRASRPALFVDTLLSMPASRLGIGLRLRGSTAVLGGSSPFEPALEWVRSGREHTVLAGAGEYLSPKCARYYQALAARSGVERAPLGQGAGFVVLESEAHAAQRGVRPLAELLGAGAASEPQQVSVPWSSDPQGRALAVAMRAALADAGVEAGAVDAVALASGDDASEAGERAALRAVFGGRAEALSLIRPKRLTGEALGASSAFTLVAALAGEGDRPAVVLVNAFEMGGAVTTLVLGIAQ